MKLPMDSFHFLMEKFQEPGAEVRSIRGLWWIRKVEEAVGREKLFGMFLLAIDECGVVDGFCPEESLFVLLNMVSVRFAVDNEARFFV